MFYLRELFNNKLKNSILIFLILIILIIGFNNLINSKKLISSHHVETIDSEDIVNFLPEDCIIVMEEPIMAPLLEDNKKISIKSVPELEKTGVFKDKCLILYYDHYCRVRGGCESFKKRNSDYLELINIPYKLKSEDHFYMILGQ